METPQERLLRYLDDAHAAEVGIEEMLRAAIDHANNVQAKSAFQEHLAVTQNQAQRLEQRIIALGGKTSGGKGIINSILGKVSDLVNIGHDDFDKATQDLIKAYSTEHLEVGMYTSMKAYAEQLGDTETVALAERAMAEEKEAAEILYPLIAESARTAIIGAAAPA
jgi:ferritin-like metal-binding protein YciE